MKVEVWPERELSCKSQAKFVHS